MKVEISGHFTYKKIFRLTIAPILMMVFISLYSVVDGICISNLSTNPDSFAGVNLIYPITTVIGGLGMLFGAGGSALIGKLLGQKQKELAREAFTNVIITATIIGAIFSVIGYFIVEPFAYAMSKVTSEDVTGMIDEAINYGQILMIGQFLFIVQNMFHTLFVVDEKPHLGFIFSIAAGVTNIIFDIIFIGPLQMAATGAAIATVMGFAVGAIGPILYFVFNKKGNIYFVKTKFNPGMIIKSATNGLSEFINFSAMAISGILFNIQLLKYYGPLGQTGVESYGVIMYVILIFVAIFLGYSNTMSPVVSYNLGSDNKRELSNVLGKSLVIITGISILMMMLGEVLSWPIALAFDHDTTSAFFNMTIKAMRLWSISFLFFGFAIYGTTFFVGLNNGLIALFISFTRSVGLVVLFVFVLPMAMGADGIWLSPACSEGGGAVLAMLLIFVYQKKYGYQLVKKKKATK